MSKKPETLEHAVTELLLFHDKFVDVVRDHSGNDLFASEEWPAQVDALRDALAHQQTQSLVALSSGDSAIVLRERGHVEIACPNLDDDDDDVAPLSLQLATGVAGVVLKSPSVLKAVFDALDQLADGESEGEAQATVIRAIAEDNS